MWMIRVWIMGLLGFTMTSLSMSMDGKRELRADNSQPQLGSTHGFDKYLQSVCQFGNAKGSKSSSLPPRCLELLHAKEADRNGEPPDVKAESFEFDVEEVDDGYLSINRDSGSVSPIMSTMGEEDGEDKAEELTSPLPPSSKRRRWGLGFGLVALFAIVSLLWVYRHSLPLDRIRSCNPIPESITASMKRLFASIPALNLSMHMPTITSSSFSLPSLPSISKPRNRSAPHFRPDSTSLAQWSEEEDPSLSSSDPRTASRSSWKSKFSLLGTGSGRKSRRGGSKPANGLFIGDLDEEEAGYEEVGLLPSPAGRGRYYGSYGTV